MPIRAHKPHVPPAKTMYGGKQIRRGDVIFALGDETRGARA
jgi:hypothetical protein